MLLIFFAVVLSSNRFLLVPVEPVEKPFPDIEVENRRWFEDFGREMRGRKQKYINKTNPKKGSANYEMGC